MHVQPLFRISYIFHISIAFVYLTLPIILFSLPTTAAADSTSKSILIMGDSLSAEYGLKSGEGWVAQLQERLNSTQKERWIITNASISGETAAQGARKLPRRLEQHQPGWVFIELGANDALRGTPIAKIRESLVSMIEQSKAAEAKVLLIGLRMPPNYGPVYTKQFTDLYASLATHHELAFVPYFLNEVATEPSLMQDDRLHPNAAAQSIMLDNVWRVFKSTF